MKAMIKEHNIQFFLRRAFKKIIDYLVGLGYEEEEILFGLFFLCEEKIYQQFSSVNDAKNYIDSISEKLFQAINQNEVLEDYLDLESRSKNKTH